MGGGRSSLVIEQEMMNVSDFSHNITKTNANEPVMYPTNYTDDSHVSEHKTVHARGHVNHCNGTHTGSDVVKRSFTPDSLSPDTLSHSSQGSSHSTGVDAVSTLHQLPSPFHSTPKKHNISLSKHNRSGPNAKCSGSQEDSGTESLGTRLCNCDGKNSSCEIIVTKHESVVAKKLLNSSFRKSRSLSDAILLQREQQKPRWKIEVDMECTRVIYGSLERNANVSLDTQKDMKDESTETENGKDYIYSDEEDSGEYVVNSIPENEDDLKKRKHFWTRKKKRKTIQEKNNSKAAMSDNGSTLKHKHLWPFLKTDESNRPETGYTYTPKQVREMRQSLYEEKLRYLHIAARVSSPRAADVRATLLVQSPVNKLTNAQLSTKTYLLSVTLNAFFYPYPATYVEWIESLSEIIQERTERGDIMPKFVDSEINECKVCLILTQDAGILLGKPDSALIHDLANIAGYSPKNIFVMEVTNGCSTPSTPEKFAPICELEEFEEDGLEDDAVVHENGTQT